MKMHNPCHPGQILENYLVGLNTTTVAHQLGLTEEQLCRVLAGRDPVTPSLAKAIATRFATDQDIWLRLQQQWDEVQEMRG
jgi:addiction module HigA family antidote